MTLGSVIKRCRKIRHLAMKHLGLAVGYTEKNAISHIANYESDHIVPNKKMKKRLASVLGISEYAISVPSLKTDIEIMHTLFKLDSIMPVTVGEYEEQIFMFAMPQTDKTKEYFKAWIEKQNELRQGIITLEDYDLWKYGFEGTADGGI